MVFDMKINKITSLLMACSFLSMSITPVLADEYMMLPPILDEKSVQDQPLPDFSQKQKMNVNNCNTNYVDVDTYTSAPLPLKGTISTVPVGTAFQVITNENINTKRNTVGEIFTTRLNHPISVDGNIIIPAGSEVIGQITYVEDAGRVSKNAKMEVKFTSIKPLYGNRIPIVGKALTKDNTGILKGGTIKEQLVSHVKTEAVSAAGGAIVGMGLGAVAGSVGAGTAIGAAGGGGIGLGWLLWRKGKEVKMPSGTKMIVILEQSFNIGK